MSDDALSHFEIGFADGFAGKPVSDVFSWQIDYASGHGAGVRFRERVLSMKPEIRRGRNLYHGERLEVVFPHALHGVMPSEPAPPGPGPTASLAELMGPLGMLRAVKGDRITYRPPAGEPRTAMVESVGRDRGERCLFLDDGCWARDRWILTNHGKPPRARTPKAATN
jgi:hypothetical protein